ncbi:MAG TPA: M1 family metallopeptidase, partial [Alicyclobacillus sp.]|nr:M1 family metallopeptidase [Alicyclobacillus sp.]
MAMFRWWFSWALILAISLSSTAVVIKSTVYPERPWFALAVSATSRITQSLASSWSRVAAAMSAGKPAPPEAAPSKWGSAPVHYTLRATLDSDHHRITGEETVEWRQSLPSPWYFYLYQEGSGTLHVQSVKQDGQPLPYEVRNDGLWISAPGNLGSRVTIEFVTDVSTTSLRYGDIDEVWTLSYWYPLLAVRDHG